MRSETPRARAISLSDLLSDGRLVACSAVVGFVFTCSIVIGASFAETLSFEGAFGNTGRALASVACIVALTGLFAAALAVAYRAIGRQADARAAHAGREAADSFAVHLKKRFPLYVGLLALAWLPTIVVHAPGTITYDNFVQMLVDDGLTKYYSAHNPPFDTWLYGLFWSIGDALGNRSIGLVLHTLLQCAFVVSGLAASFCWLRLVRVPRGVRIGLFAIACALPLFPLSAECMTKDYSFAAVFLPWSLMICEYVHTRGRFFDRRLIVAVFVIVSILLMMTKKTGVYVAVPVALLALAVLRKDGVRLLLSTLGAAFVYLVAFEMVFFSLFGIVNGSSREMLSVPMQQTARCALEHPGDVTDAENDAIATVFGEEWQSSLPEAYDPALSDPVKSQFDPYASKLDTLSYFSAWLSQGVRHPVTYLESFFANTYECAYPFVLMSLEMDIPAEWGTPEFAESMLIYTREDVSVDEVRESIGGVHSSTALAPAREAYSTAYSTIAQLPVVNVLTSKALYATWIPLFTVGCLVYRREAGGLLMVSPSLLCLCALLAGPVTQSRYIAPELYAFALIIGACWVTTRARNMSARTTVTSPRQRRKAGIQGRARHSMR